MNIRVVHEPISIAEVRALAQEIYQDLIKGVADIEKGIIALGGEWHMDANKVLLANGSKQENVWGFNIYPDEKDSAALEFISLINIRPAQGNRGMEIANKELRQKIHDSIAHLIPDLFV